MFIKRLITPMPLKSREALPYFNHVTYSKLLNYKAADPFQAGNKAITSISIGTSV